AFGVTQIDVASGAAHVELEPLASDRRVITCVTPPRGGTARGATVTIRGANFPCPSTVRIGATPVTATSCSDTLLTADLPRDAAPGPPPLDIAGVAPAPRGAPFPWSAGRASFPEVSQAPLAVLPLSLPVVDADGDRHPDVVVHTVTFDPDVHNAVQVI